MRFPIVGRIATLALALLVAPLATDAQQPTKMFRIGVLNTGSSPSGPSPGFEAFRQSLHDLGYVEGQNLIIELRYAERSEERARNLAAELVRLKVDVIVATSGLPARGARKATSTIPIVMAVGDALAQGLVPSLARPGSNITGITFMNPELSQKRLEILREALPQIVRVAVLWCPDLAGSPPQWSEIQVGAGRLGLQLHSLEVRGPDDFEPALAAATRDGAEALFVTGCDLFEAGRIVPLAGRHRLPAIYASKGYVVAGGLMAYGASTRETPRRLAVYVDKILQGAPPADLPVEQAMQFELVINLKTAAALGLTIPPTLLFQADEVIK